MHFRLGFTITSSTAYFVILCLTVAGSAQLTEDELTAVAKVKTIL